MRQRRKHPEYAERILQKELAGWAHRDARTIKPREVIELLDAIVDRPAPVMANRVAGLLSQMFRYGIHCPPWDSVNFVLLKKLAQQYRYCPYSLQAYHMSSKRPKNGEPL